MERRTDVGVGPVSACLKAATRLAGSVFPLVSAADAGSAVSVPFPAAGLT